MRCKKTCPIPAVSAIIIENGRILLIKRGHEPNRGLWSLPGGSIEPGESVKNALAREVLEETSLTVEVGDVAGVRDVIVREGDNVTYHYVIVNFHAKVISGELKAATDADDARWVPLNEIACYSVTPGLQDCLTFWT